MIRLRTFLPIVATSLIVFLYSTQSQAGCAWILWHKSQIVVLIDSKKSTTDGWQVNQSLDNKKECVAALTYIVNAEVAERKKPRPDGPRTITNASFGLSDTSGKIVHTVFSDDGSPAALIDEYLCVPDTVDPRSKK